MTPAFRNVLPAWLAQRVDETEAAIGFEIEVVVRPADEHLSVDLDIAYARIRTPSLERFAAGSVFHELTHIRRNLVEGVPRLDAAAEIEDVEVFELVRAAAVIEDNAIEHLVIVPEELAAFPERQPHWEEVVRRNLARIEAGEGTQAQQTATALGAWLFVCLALDNSPVKDDVRSLLQPRGLYEMAEAETASVLANLGDKVALTRAWFDLLGMDGHQVELEYLNPQTGHRRRANLLPVA